MNLFAFLWFLLHNLSFNFYDLKCFICIDKKTLSSDTCINNSSDKWNLPDVPYIGLRVLFQESYNSREWAKQASIMSFGLIFFRLVWGAPDHSIYHYFVMQWNFCPLCSVKRVNIRTCNRFYTKNSLFVFIEMFFLKTCVWVWHYLLIPMSSQMLQFSP